MKRKALALMLVLAFSYSVLVSLATANPAPNIVYPFEPNKKPPTLKVQSPQNGDIFKANTVNVNFSVTKPASWLSEGALYYSVWFAPSDRYPRLGETTSIMVFLDESLNAQYPAPLSNSVFTKYSTVLNNITDGEHTLRIDVIAESYYKDPNYTGGLNHLKYPINVSETIQFVVEAASPNITILSPISQMYNVTDIPLNFKVSEPVSKLTYSLDGQANITISGNTILTGLSVDSHNVTVYALDAAGNVGASETITFTIAIPEPFPTNVVATASAAAAIVGLGLLVYFKKRKS